MTWPTTDTTAARTADSRPPRGAAATAIALVAPPRNGIFIARLTAAAIAAALLAMAIFATGCKGSGSGAAGGVAAATGSSADPATLGKLVKSGPAPLNYRLAAAGTLRVLDTTDNNALVVSTAVPASAIVSIDEVKGVLVNGGVVKAGPLAPHHRYAVYLRPNSQQ